MGRKRRDRDGKMRWKYLTTEDALPVSKSSLRRSQMANELRRNQNKLELAPITTSKGSVSIGYDIDGDGVIDARELKLAQRLHDVAVNDKNIDEAGLNVLRQKMGRRILAEDFILRNKDALWRFGDQFTGQSMENSIHMIAEHPHFGSVISQLEGVERQRKIRSSCGVRNTFQGLNGKQNEKVLQTWVHTTRKTRKNKLQHVQVKKSDKGSDSHRSMVENEVHDDILVNDYGALDLDGDGVIDEDEMKLATQLKSMMMTSNDSLQHEGRRLMVRELVNRHPNEMWKFNTAFKNMSENEIVDHVVKSSGFSKYMNKLRAKERILGFKSSKQVSSCMADPRGEQFIVQQPVVMTSRAVKCRTEMLQARSNHTKQKYGEDRGVFMKTKSLSKSVSSPIFGKPVVFATPKPLGTTHFNVTKRY